MHYRVIISTPWTVGIRVWSTRKAYGNYLLNTHFSIFEFLIYFCRDKFRLYIDAIITILTRHLNSLISYKTWCLMYGVKRIYRLFFFFMFPEHFQKVDLFDYCSKSLEYVFFVIRLIPRVPKIDIQTTTFHQREYFT